MASTVYAKGVAAPYRDSAPAVTREGDRTVIWLDGEHDIATLPDLTDTMAKAISVSDGDIAVDLSGTSFLSMATVGELIAARTFLREHGRELTVRAPSRRAMRIIDICGLGDVFHVSER
jgi:anti-anti-sigma factor